MALEDTDNFTKKLYLVRDSYHARLIKKAKREGITLQDAVNEAFKQYLSGATADAGTKVKPSANK